MTARLQQRPGRLGLPRLALHVALDGTSLADTAMRLNDHGLVKARLMDQERTPARVASQQKRRCLVGHESITSVLVYSPDGAERTSDPLMGLSTAFGAQT